MRMYLFKLKCKTCKTCTCYEHDSTLYNSNTVQSTFISQQCTFTCEFLETFKQLALRHILDPH